MTPAEREPKRRRLPAANHPRANRQVVEGPAIGAPGGAKAVEQRARTVHQATGQAIAVRQQGAKERERAIRRDLAKRDTTEPEAATAHPSYPRSESPPTRRTSLSDDESAHFGREARVGQRTTDPVAPVCGLTPS